MKMMTKMMEYKQDILNIKNLLIEYKVKLCKKIKNSWKRIMIYLFIMRKRKLVVKM